MSKVEISENTVGGDVVGGNKTVTSIQVTYRASVYLEKLYEKLKDEPKTQDEINFIEDLLHYTSKLDGDVLGLDEKLKAANRESRLWFAKQLKEKYHKKLLKTSQFSTVAQKINVYLLAQLRTNFLSDVYPTIVSNDDEKYVDILINERVIKTIAAELGQNDLDFTSEHILGMLYFLTGNCHLKWTK